MSSMRKGNWSQGLSHRHVGLRAWMGHPREGTAECLPHPAISKPDLPKAAGSDSNNPTPNPGVTAGASNCVWGPKLPTVVPARAVLSDLLGWLCPASPGVFSVRAQTPGCPSGKVSWDRGLQSPSSPSCQKARHLGRGPNPSDVRFPCIFLSCIISSSSSLPLIHPHTCVSSRSLIFQPTHPSIKPSVHPFTHASIHSPIHPLTHPSTHPSIHPPTHSLSVHPSNHPSMCMSTHLSLLPSLLRPGGQHGVFLGVCGSIWAEFDFDL